ncbi:MAG: hypothetical protein K2R93_21735 [Gemmatimonadaceae bacterium]|nr:hypothetical protein [Gemmatimonadaceae bacterium]
MPESTSAKRTPPTWLLGLANLYGLGLLACAVMAGLFTWRRRRPSLHRIDSLA